MARTIYVVIDTNILVRVISQGKAGCEFETWQQLKNLVDEDSIILLVPEIVLLELKKQWRRLPEQFEKNITALERSIEKHIEGAITFNEIADLGDSLLSHLADKKIEKITNANQYHNDVQVLLSAKKAIFLPLDLETWFRAKRRSLSGGLADPDRASEGDCCLIESLLNFFEKQHDKGTQLLFCTENVSDFGVLVDKENAKYSLDPAVNDGLPPTELFINLDSLLAFVKEHKVVKEPPPEVLLEAVAQQQTRRVTAAVAMDEALSERELNLIRPVFESYEEHRRMAEAYNSAALSAAEERRCMAEAYNSAALSAAEERRRMAEPYIRAAILAAEERKRMAEPSIRAAILAAEERKRMAESSIEQIKKSQEAFGVVHEMKQKSEQENSSDPNKESESE